MRQTRAKGQRGGRVRKQEIGDGWRKGGGLCIHCVHVGWKRRWCDESLLAGSNVDVERRVKDGMRENRTGGKQCDELDRLSSRVLVFWARPQMGDGGDGELEHQSRHVTETVCPSSFPSAARPRLPGLCCPGRGKLLLGGSDVLARAFPSRLNIQFLPLFNTAHCPSPSRSQFICIPVEVPLSKVGQHEGI